MSRFYRSPAVFLAGMYTCTLVILLLVNGRPSFLDPPVYPVEEKKQWRESMESIEHFYAQRCVRQSGHQHRRTADGSVGGYRLVAAERIAQAVLRPTRTGGSKVR
jgi:hypothetical protein